MAEDKKKINFFGILFLGLLLSALSYWTYQQVTLTYQKLEKSNALIETALENQSIIVQGTEQELALLKQSLTKTEELVNKYQEENDKLREKIKLLDQLGELEDTISRLKERNARIINHMSSTKSVKREPVFNSTNIQTVDKGKSLIDQFRSKIQEVKVRIRDIKRATHQKKIEEQEEQDKIHAMLGNNGYLIRNGDSSPVYSAFPPPNKVVNIDVQFVE